MAKGKRTPSGLKVLTWAINNGFVKNYYFTPEKIYSEYIKKGGGKDG